MKSSNIFLIGLVLVILISQSGCTPSREQPQIDNNADVNPKTNDNQNESLQSQIREGYEKKIHRAFSVQMPEEWKEVEYNNILFYLPPGSEAADQIAEKVNVIASTGIQGTNTLSSILDKGIENTKKLVPDFSVKKREEIKLGGFDAIRLTLVGTVMGKKFENTQISTLNNDVMITIAHNCFEDNCKYSEVYENMVESLEVYTEFCGIEIIGFSEISPARDTGMFVGEKILLADGEPIDNLGALTHALAPKRAGDTIIIKTQNKEYNIKVIAGADGQGAFIGVNLAQVYCKR